MAKKKQTISTLKKQSWQEFSKWIRLRDCVKTTGDTESGVCITCGKLIPFKQSQAGHFIAGRVNAVLFDEDIVHLQCLTEESKITLANLEEKSIKDIKVGDVVCAFNETSYNKELAEVLDVDSYMPDKLYEVELENGDKFYATGDHKVVANGKWYRIDEMLDNNNTYDILEM